MKHKEFFYIVYSVISISKSVEVLKTVIYRIIPETFDCARFVQVEKKVRRVIFLGSLI